MEEWFESLEQCVNSGVVELKSTFDIVTNFSFIKAKAFQALNAGAPNFAYDASVETLFSFDLEAAEIGSGIQICNVELDEELHSEGIYAAEILFKYEVSEQLIIGEHNSAVVKLIEINTQLVDFLKVCLTLAGKEFTVIPSTLNLRIMTPNGWRRVTQSSGEQPKIEALPAEIFDDFVKTLQHAAKAFARYNIEKKLKSLIDVMASGVRLETRNFDSDALLNFYKVIETVVKDPAFVTHSTGVLGRPLAYGQAIVNSGQRGQVAYVWEYLNKINPEIGDDVMETLVDISDARSKLAHAGTAELKFNTVPVCKAVAIMLLRKYIELKTAAD